MKLVSGRSLDALIRTAPGLPGRLALLPHLLAVAEAVAYAHSQRVVHALQRWGEELEAALRVRAPAQPLYLDRKREPGKLVQTWNLVVPERVLSRSWGAVA